MYLELGLARQLPCKISGTEHYVEAATTIATAISVRSDPQDCHRRMKPHLRGEIDLVEGQLS